MLATKHLSDTIVAQATPPGTGAIAVIRLSGPEAIPLVNSVFKGKDLTQQATHTLHFGKIVNKDGSILDEVLISLFRNPASYTGEDTIEVSCHGSPYIIRQCLQLFVEEGARPAEPGEFTLRAFLNGKLDLSQAEAVADLIAADSASAHQLAMQQMRGGFSNKIQALRARLIDFASLIELELDFSEEDVAFANRDQLRQLLHELQSTLDPLIQSFQLGNVLKNGVNTVIAGRPNAGKSTLLNALLQENRAIVSDIAGTTRDTIEEVLNIDGIPFRLIDTAGIREAQDQIEAIGVEKTLAKIAESSLLLYVFDVIESSPDDVRGDLEKLLRPGMHLLVIANKMDLNPYTRFEHYFPEGQDLGLQPEQWIPVSAINEMNLPYLREKLHQAVVSEQVQAGDTIVSNIRHYQALRQARESLGEVLQGLDSGISSDFLAMDIRRALAFLGEITGEISTEDLLGNIFGKFCIGK